MLYEREKNTLSEFACLSANTKGRENPISPCGLRTEFQRDRDRIIHSKAFRRLMHKTQVFLSPEADHYRTRLTHTFEVSQIARTIARSLRLNEDLCEAIALGHDLGHTPFGHAGERVLQRCYSKDFTHYKQSLRVVEKLENSGKGLNLTYEVRDGIVKHTSGPLPETLEGRVVRFADRIAYMNHDIDDACRAGIMCLEDIPSEIREVIGTENGERIDSMVLSIVNSSMGKNEIIMDDDMLECFNKLHEFLFAMVYTNPKAKGEESKAEELLESLYYYFVKYPEKIPEDACPYIALEPIERCVCDYISGMSDRYAINIYKEIFIPEAWRESNRLSSK